MTRRVAVLAVLVALATQACVGPFARPKARPTVNTDPVPSSNTYRELTYVHPTAGFSLGYPEGMTLVDASPRDGFLVELTSHAGGVAPAGFTLLLINLPREAPSDGLEGTLERLCVRGRHVRCRIEQHGNDQWLRAMARSSGGVNRLGYKPLNYLITRIHAGMEYTIEVSIRDDRLATRQVAVAERIIASIIFQPSR